MPKPEFVRVASLSDIPPGNCLTVDGHGRQIALCNVDGELHALNATCPHHDGPLGKGHLDNGALVCPWHGWAFKIESGACVQNPSIAVRRYRVRVEGTDILIAL